MYNFTNNGDVFKNIIKSRTNPFIPRTPINRVQIGPVQFAPIKGGSVFQVLALSEKYPFKKVSSGSLVWPSHCASDKWSCRENRVAPHQLILKLSSRRKRGIRTVFQMGVHVRTEIWPERFLNNNTDVLSVLLTRLSSGVGDLSRK